MLVSVLNMRLVIYVLVAVMLVLVAVMLVFEWH